MSSWLRLAVTSLTLLGLAPLAAADPLIVLPPIGETPAASDLGALMQIRAGRTLIENAAGPVADLRQILAAAETLQIVPAALKDSDAEKLAKVIGARRFVFARLTGKAAPYTLEVRVVDQGKAGAPQRTVLPAKAAAAVSAGARALATAAVGRAPAKETAALDADDGAVASDARCHAALAQQPIALDSPLPLRSDALARAVTACKETIALAPALDEARAALALAQAMMSRSQEAVDLLRAVPTQRYETSLWLAHYWIATRHRSPDAGLEILREAVKRWPSSLYAQVLLAEHLIATRRYKDALPVAQALQAQAPLSAISHARVSAVLGRLGRTDEALKLAEEVAQRAPEDPRNLTTLASRYLDANRPQDALKALQPIAGTSARALNLEGWAQLRLDKPTEAKTALARAVEKTNSGQLDWRTRGRALAGLVRLAASQGDAGALRGLVSQITQEGFIAFVRAMEDPTVNRALDNAGTPKIDLAVKPSSVQGPRYVRPSEATPFSLDPTGDIDPRGRALTNPPNQIELLRF